MRNIAKRMEEIPFSGIRHIFERVQRLERESKSIIHLEIGQPDFDTPTHIKQAKSKAIDDGLTHYTSNYGIMPLRKAISKKLEQDNNLQFSPENEIIVTLGVSEAIFISMMALLNPGDEVLVLEPLFPNYLMAARMAGAIPVPVPTHQENNYQPDITDLKQKLTSRTRMLVIATPGNPTGTLLEECTLQSLADFSIENDLLVISDEIYEKLIYDDRKHLSIASLPGMRSRTLTLNGFSKSYSMTGWRVGYVAADESLIQALIRIHQYTVVCANSTAQWGALAALEGSQDSLKAMVDEFDRRRLLVIDRLSEVPSISFPRPRGAIYAYIDISQLSTDAYHFTDDLLLQAHVAVVPWDKNHIRISYGVSYGNLEIALERFHEFCFRQSSK